MGVLKGTHVSSTISTMAPPLLAVRLPDQTADGLPEVAPNCHQPPPPTKESSPPGALCRAPWARGYSRS
ncbi:hypothetical protein GH733_015209 [Mirounga leonina]|nr:hypothetical protein GH733_015209 [Mirounga leonina]